MTAGDQAYGYAVRISQLGNGAHNLFVASSSSEVPEAPRIRWATRVRMRVRRTWLSFPMAPWRISAETTARRVTRITTSAGRSLPAAWSAYGKESRSAKVRSLPLAGERFQHHPARAQQWWNHTRLTRGLGCRRLLCRRLGAGDRLSNTRASFSSTMRCLADFFVKRDQTAPLTIQLHGFIR